MVFLYRKLLEPQSEEKMVRPLTNVALLLRAFPDSREKIFRIVLMGRCYRGGNAASAAEFNI